MIASRVLLPGMASCVIIIGRSVAGFFCFEIDERDRAAAFAPTAEGSIDCDCAFRPHPMNWPIEPKRSAAPRSIGAALSRCCPRQLLISRFGDVRRAKAKPFCSSFFICAFICIMYVHPRRKPPRGRVVLYYTHTPPSTIFTSMHPSTHPSLPAAAPTPHKKKRPECRSHQGQGRRR